MSGTPAYRPRSRLGTPQSSGRLRQPFRSPLLSGARPPAAGAPAASPSGEGAGSGAGASPALRAAAADSEDARLRAVEQEIARLEGAGCRAEELPRYIAALHRYNEAKDACQLVLGRIAELDGVTVREVHSRYPVLPETERG